jgi:hypothetical protein
MIALLARHSSSGWEVGYAGQVDRLREHPQGQTAADRAERNAMVASQSY